MTKKGIRTEAGRYYGVTHSGRMEELPADGARAPHFVICRRVEDYPDQRVPAGGGVGECCDCLTPIVFNPRGPHPTVPRRCMQCAQVEPLPFPPQAS